MTDDDFGLDDRFGANYGHPGADSNNDGIIDMTAYDDDHTMPHYGPDARYGSV